MKFWEICKSDATFTVKTFWAGGQKVLSDWQIWRSFMPIRAVEISKKFLIFLFSPPYLDFPPPKPLPSAPQSFFPPFSAFFGTLKKKFFGNFSHLALFGTFWPNLPRWSFEILKLQLTPVRIFRTCNLTAKNLNISWWDIAISTPTSCRCGKGPWSDCLDM